MPVAVSSNDPVVDGRLRVGFGKIETPCKCQRRSKRGPPGRSKKEPAEGCDGVLRGRRDARQLIAFPSKQLARCLGFQAGPISVRRLQLIPLSDAR